MESRTHQKPGKSEDDKDPLLEVIVLVDFPRKRQENKLLEGLH